MLHFSLLLLFLTLPFLSGCGSHSSSNQGYLLTGEKKKGTLNELLTAIESGDLATLERLRSSGLNVNEYLSNGRTPLIHATIQNRIRVMNWLLLNGADKSLVDGEQKSALDHATDVGNIRAWLLLDAEKQKEERQILLNAIRNERTLKIDEQLENGTDPNFTDDEAGGESPLTLAVALGSEIIVERLAEWKDPLEVTTTNLDLKNQAGLTALQVAKAKNLSAIVALLERLGAKD